MRDLNKAMKKLQEAKRLESTKLAKLVKESVVEPENKEETFDNKFNYKVSLDNGKTITATCSKENIEDARKYFLGKSYLNTKTGEKAKIVGVEEINSDENGFEEIKNEEFGSTSKQLTDNDPAQKVPFDSDAKKDIEKAATQKPKIVAEEFGSENKDLTDNDPAQKKAFETETRKKMDDATKGKAIDDKIDESKKLNEATEEDINNENKLEKAKQLIEVIFNMDSLDETRRAAKQELKDLVYPQRIEPEKTEKKIVKESIFDNDEETKVKEDRLADLRTQLEVDGEQLADDEKEAIQAEIDSLEKDLYESKQLKEDWDDENDDDDEDDEEYELIACNKDNDTLKSLSACIGDYEASMTGITGCPEYQELVEYAENNKEVDKIYIDYPDREYVIWTRVFGDYPEFDSLEEADEAEDEEGYDNLDESKQLNEESTLGKTLEVIYTDKDGEEKTTHFKCDKEYELDGEQIREAIKSSNNDIVDIIKINESKCLTEDDDHEEDEEVEKEETLDGKDVTNTFKNYKAFEANFGPIKIVKNSYDKNYKVYRVNEEDADNYIYYSNDKDNIEGWLYGAVQAANGKFNKLKNKNEAVNRSIFNEETSNSYTAISYYDDKLRGVEDETSSSDWSVITDFAHDKLMGGSYVKITNTTTGKEKVISPDTYQDEFDGEFVVGIGELDESVGDKSQEETLDEAINRAYEEELSAINTYDLVLNKIENEESNEKLIEMINEIKKDEEDHKSLLKHYIETGEALTDDELEELKNSEESNEDNSEEEVSIENIDDETFTEAFTKFIKENYKNAKEFKLENVFKSGNNYRFECKLTFNSGKKVKVNLMSEAKIKEGKSLIRFYENKTFKHLDENKSIMTATVKLENKTLSCEALRYNYRVALKENKIATIKGIIK